MVCIAFTGDWHLHNYAPFARPWRDGLNSRCKHIYQVVGEWLPKQLEAHNIDLLIHLGDWNWNASNDYRAVNLTREAGYACESKVREVIALHGNHDTLSRFENSHNAFPYLKNPIWGPVRFGDHVFWPVGYNTRLPKPEEISKFWCEKKVFFLLHKDIEDGKAATGFIYRNRGEVKISELLALKQRIPEAIFVGGHYHQNQTIRKLVVIAGAPVQHNKGDAGCERGFLKYDHELSEFSFVKSDGPQFLSGSFELAEQLLSSMKAEDLERVYYTLEIENDPEQRKRAAKLITAGLNADIREVVNRRTDLVQPQKVDVESELELLDRWLKEREPNLSQKDRAQLVRVAETIN